MKFYENVREFIWPILEPLEQKEIDPIKVENLTVKEDDLEKCYDLILKYYDSEDERKKTIESKTTIFIGIVGFVIAILLSMATGLLLNPKIKFDLLTSFSVIMWVIIVIYFCRAVWFSIKALEIQKYQTIGYENVIQDKTEYKRELIADIINKTRMNSITINLKVDNMGMAQDYFKRGIVSVVLYALIAGSYGLISKGSLCYAGLTTKVLDLLETRWIALLNAVVWVINLTIFIVFYRSRKS